LSDVTQTVTEIYVDYFLGIKSASYFALIFVQLNYASSNKSDNQATDNSSVSTGVSRDATAADNGIWHWYGK